MTDNDAILLGPDTRDVWILTDGDRIARRGTGPPPDDIAARHLTCAGAIIAPGAVNAHTHLYSGLAPLGMPIPAADAGFMEILETLWWKLDRSIDEAALRAAARLYVAEALLAGTTTLIDHHESPNFIEGSLDVLADACQDLGVRALLCYGATERNGGRTEAHNGLLECRRFLESNTRPLVQGAIGLHASFTVSDETIQEAAALCRELATVMHLHLAEDVADIHDAERRGFPGPLERLEALDALIPHSILAHGVHLDAAQVKRIEARNCWLIQNPRSNLNNRVGYPGALGTSRRVALGTDGYPADMTAEMEALVNVAGECGDRPEMAAVRNAAGCLLSSELLGAPSASRELQWDVADARVFDESGKICHVLVAGRVIVENGRLVSGDLEKIRKDGDREARLLWQRMEDM